MLQSSFGKVVPVLLGLSLIVAEGVNYSLIGPFFPTEASIHKDISTTSIGIITGTFDVANFFAAIVLTSFITPKNQKIFFCFGASLSATSNGLFGLLKFCEGGPLFIVLCTLLRVLMGTGASMVYSTAVPLLVPIYPEWSGRIASLFETCFGLGMMLGPLFGSLLFSFGGYITPFIFAACSQILIVFVCILFLPNKAIRQSDASDCSDSSLIVTETNDESRDLLNEQAEEKTEMPGFTFKYFATRTNVLVIGLTLALHSATYGFIDVALAPYLLKIFGITGNSSGYYFLALLGIYVTFLPLLGFLVDRGQAGRIFLIACFASFLAFVMLALPAAVSVLETKIWVIFWLMVLGAACAGGYAAIYLLLEKLAYGIGFQVESNVKLLAAALSNACFASGRIIGATIVGGAFMDQFGYYYSCSLLSGLFLLVLFPCCYVLIREKMLRKIYYLGPEDNKN